MKKIIIAFLIPFIIRTALAQSLSTDTDKAVAPVTAMLDVQTAAIGTI
jgi:hypothetical protein